MKCALGEFSDEVQQEIDKQLLKWTRHEVFKQLQFMAGKVTTPKAKGKLKGKSAKESMMKLEKANKFPRKLFLEKTDIKGMEVVKKGPKVDRSGKEVPTKSKKDSKSSEASVKQPKVDWAHHNVGVIELNIIVTHGKGVWGFINVCVCVCVCVCV